MIKAKRRLLSKVMAARFVAAARQSLRSKKSTAQIQQALERAKYGE